MSGENRFLSEFHAQLTVAGTETDSFVQFQDSSAENFQFTLPIKTLWALIWVNYRFSGFVDVN